ncbi:MULTISPECIES: hypothetical protein [Streptomyces]|uniref:Uncharacterized protein n=1 Tax=Streptomyces bugieae TaxID=3098223 RepID=A0ABU7NKA2_9ACTN|nr:hypothetical protein [Streptomyces nigrescens]MEE4418852.1 hypothetical protein [Streptomyces sp. DSM 41528]
MSPDRGLLVPNDLLAETAVCIGEFQVKVAPLPLVTFQSLLLSAETRTHIMSIARDLSGV